MGIFAESVFEAACDTLKTLPILFLAYLLVAFLSHDHSHKFSHFLGREKKSSVLYASLLGCVPQCGFSSVVADLYSRRAVTLGTLVAVFVATSDEAIPLMIANPESIVSLLELIAIKIVLAIFWGYLIDLCLKTLSKFRKNKFSPEVAAESGHEAEETGAHQEHEEHDAHNEKDEHGGEAVTGEAHALAHSHHHTCGHIHTDECGEACAHSHGACCGNNILAEAFDHMFEIAIYIFAASFIFNLIIGFCGLDFFESLLTDNVFVQVLIAGIIGLIPNCASSVFLVELFLENALMFPALVAGLTTGAGVGLVILISRNKKRPLENVGVVVLQYVIGILSGFLMTLFF